MSTLEAVRAANSVRFANAQQPLVGVFTGGTSGIGEYTLHTFAKHAAAGPGATIYIVGRSKSAADEIATDLASLKKIRIQFIQANDLPLLKDVDRCCNELSSLLSNSSPHIDLLVLSHADLWLGPRRETSEGLDKLFSLLYYSRIRFVHQLLPFLTATPLPSTRVISIYAAGLEDPHKNFFPDDLSLRDTRNFSYTATRNHVVHMKTMAFETIAQQYPNVGLVHVFPGLVITPGFDRNPLPWWFRVLWTIFRPIAGWFALKHEDSGEWTLGLTSDRFGRAGQSKAGGEAAAESTDGVVGGGAYSAKYNGQVYGNIAVYEGLRKKGFREKVWEHTMSAFKEISEGRVFKD